jgi:hypothetical protein
MNKFRFTIKFLVIATFLLAFASIAQAQATRTWVSGVGDDVNPCSRTAPCKTYAGAISKTAAGGEISTLDPGGFGTVTITKNITIDGTQGAGFGSILSSGVNGVNVNDSATATPNTIVVTLRNLSINGAGTTLGTNGVNFTSGKAVHVEHCDIQNFSTNGILVSVNNSAAELYVEDTTIHNVAQGIRMTQAGAGGFVVGILDGLNISHLTSGTGNGVLLETAAFATIRDSVISFAITSGAGIKVTGTGGASIVNTTVAHCPTGIALTAGSTNRITHSAIINNVTGVSFAGGAVLRSFGDNVYDNPTNFAGGAISPQGQQ